MIKRELDNYFDQLASTISEASEPSWSAGIAAQAGPVGPAGPTSPTGPLVPLGPLGPPEPLRPLVPAGPTGLIGPLRPAVLWGPCVRIICRGREKPQMGRDVREGRGRNLIFHVLITISHPPHHSLDPVHSYLYRAEH